MVSGGSRSHSRQSREKFAGQGQKALEKGAHAPIELTAFIVLVIPRMLITRFKLCACTWSSSQCHVDQSARQKMHRTHPVLLRSEDVFDSRSTQRHRFGWLLNLHICGTPSLHRLPDTGHW